MTRWRRPAAGPVAAADHRPLQGKQPWSTPARSSPSLRPTDRPDRPDVENHGDQSGRWGRPDACRPSLPGVVPERFAAVLAELAPLAERFAAAGHRLYLVGGAVRDLLVGADTAGSDLDLTTDARPARDQGRLLARVGRRRVDPGRARSARSGPPDRCRRHRLTVEITTFRAEVYHDDSRKPEVTFADAIEADLARRDFTINAMALELPGRRRPCSSTRTAAPPTWPRRRLRTPLSPEISFGDDPLRMLRAARFIARFGLTPVPELVDAVVTGGRPARDRVGRADPRRARQADRASSTRRPGCGSCVDTGLAEHFLPELPALRLEHDPIHRHKDVLSHTIAVVENVRAAPRRRLRLPRSRGWPPCSTTSASRGPAATSRARAPRSTTTTSSGRA